MAKGDLESLTAIPSVEMGELNSPPRPQMLHAALFDGTSDMSPAT